jgi:HEAT repeat protein
MRLAAWLKGLFRPDEAKSLEHYEAADLTNVESLLSAIKDADAVVRRRAVMALGDIGDARAAGPIIEMLHDADDEVRLEAVVALGKIGDPVAVEPLIDKLKSYDYFYVRKKAAYTLYTFLKQERLDDGLRQKIRAHWRSWYLT